MIQDGQAEHGCPAQTGWLFRAPRPARGHNQAGCEFGLPGGCSLVVSKFLLSFNFLSLAIRHPRCMVNNRRHLSFVILDEGQLRDIDLEEEIRFRLRINLNHTLKDVLAQGLTEQPVSFPPDRHFHSRGRPDGVRRKFVVAGDGIQKFCVQLDGPIRVGRFGNCWRPVGDFPGFQRDRPLIGPLRQGEFNSLGNVSSLDCHFIIPQKTHECAFSFHIGRQRFTRPPGFMDQFQEPVIGRLRRQVRPQESSRRSLPGAVLKVPPGNGLDRRMREKQCVKLFHIIGLSSLPGRCRRPWPG